MRAFAPQRLVATSILLALCALPLLVRAGPVTVPVDVGIGPAFHFITGPVQRDQLVHYGLKLDVAAILDHAALQANQGRVPRQYQSMVAQMEEVRVGPSIFIPETLFISPKTAHTGLYGVGWRPASLGFSLARRPARVALNAGLLLTAAYLHSTTLGNPAPGETFHMFFLRPGVDVKLEVEVPVTRGFLIGFGWSSQVYIPQEIGGSLLAIGPIDNSIWHIGQAFVQLHFRFPYTVDL